MHRLFVIFVLSILFFGCASPEGTSPTVQENTSVAVDEAAVPEVAVDTAMPEEAATVIDEANTDDMEVSTEPISETASTTNAGPILVPTDTPETEEAVAPTDWLSTVTVEDNFYILGNPNAPIRLVDFSDFL